ncbi:hypothetical protein TEA_014714 [Camellia sinensis var. sinensis]|uniref:SNARE-complex protein Syntaxin-18 N-terminal domain-containing protein n=1 Tax=Camellia sinensis var. sinensis TaxID=542762 RepID=A0A4S4ECE8_CAMSN|nr:hypothetical protein TEA_014714 [Camellia sinensis var. sinensis]
MQRRSTRLLAAVATGKAIRGDGDGDRRGEGARDDCGVVEEQEMNIFPLSEKVENINKVCRVFRVSCCSGNSTLYIPLKKPIALEKQRNSPKYRREERGESKNLIADFSLVAGFDLTPIDPSLLISSPVLSSLDLLFSRSLLFSRLSISSSLDLSSSLVSRSHLLSISPLLSSLDLIFSRSLLFSRLSISSSLDLSSSLVSRSHLLSISPLLSSLDLIFSRSLLFSRLSISSSLDLSSSLVSRSHLLSISPLLSSLDLIFSRSLLFSRLSISSSLDLSSSLVSRSHLLSISPLLSSLDLIFSRSLLSPVAILISCSSLSRSLLFFRLSISSSLSPSLSIFLLSRIVLNLSLDLLPIHISVYLFGAESRGGGDSLGGRREGRVADGRVGASTREEGLGSVSDERWGAEGLRFKKRGAGGGGNGGGGGGNGGDQKVFVGDVRVWLESEIELKILKMLCTEQLYLWVIMSSKRSPLDGITLSSHLNVEGKYDKHVKVELESTETLDQFLMKHKKDYIDLHRTTEQERDSIEHEVTIFVKACKEQIDILKTSINDEESNSKGWLGIKGDHSNVDTIAHKHGVVLILSERLHTVTSQFDQLRAIRFQEAINRATPRRKLKRVAASDSTDNSKSNTLKLKEPDNSELREPDEVQYDTVKVQQQLLDDETRALQVELTNLLDAVQETETKMVEMSALNHLMSTHVLQQAQQIEFLYEQAVAATTNVELGNKELAQAIQRNSSSRTFLLLFLFKRVAASDSTDNSKSNTLKLKEPDNSELREPDEVQYDTVKVQQQLLDDETRALQVELTNLLDAVQETETKMVEMSALNHLMSTHVLQQAQQIEFLYEQAVAATTNVELGNKELSQAIQRNSSSRTFLLLFLFVLTFSILFLDWYN